MSIYRRYFQIPKGSATEQLMARIMESRKAYNKGLANIRDEVGAKEVARYNHSGLFAGFHFDHGKRDNDVFTKPDREQMSRPRRTGKEGKALNARIEALPKPMPLKDLFRGCGLRDGDWLISEGLTFHNAGLKYSNDPYHFFITVPWKDEDPDVLSEAKPDDHLLWKPPMDWVEVKEWQMKKIIEEHKEAA